MRKHIPMALAMLLAVTFANAQRLPLPLLGEVRSDSPIESAVVVRNQSDDLFCVYASNGQLHASKRAASAGDFVPYPLDLGTADIASCRDVKAFNRFGNIWMVFFVATDHQGEESVRALEFDGSGGLSYSPYGRLDAPLTGSSVKDYSIFQDAIYSFYVVLRKESGITVCRAGDDPDNRTLMSIRQSIDARDATPISMLIQRTASHFVVFADYAESASHDYHSVLLTMRQDRVVERRDMGFFPEPANAFSAFSYEDGRERFVLARGASIQVRDITESVQSAAWDIDVPLNTNPIVTPLYPLNDHLFILARTGNSLSVADYSLSDGISMPIGVVNDSIVGASDVREIASSPGIDYVVYGSDYSGLRQIERFTFDPSDGRLVDSGPIGQFGSFFSPVKAALLREEFSEDLSTLLYDPGTMTISRQKVGDAGLKSSISGVVAVPPPESLLSSEYRGRSTAFGLVAWSPDFAVVLSEDGTASWVANNLPIGGDDKLLGVASGASLLTIYLLGD